MNRSKGAVGTAVVASIAVAGWVAPARAATVTFNAPAPIVAQTDVITAGTLVEANTFDQFANTVTENTVPFTTSTYLGGGPPFPLGGANMVLDEDGATPSAAASTGDGTYDALFTRESYTNPGNTNTLTFSGLTVGHLYDFQVFSKTNTGYITHLASGATSADLLNSTYVTASFTADATTQGLTWRGTTGASFGYGVINAIQIRDEGPAETVPEPASLGMLGLGAVALLGRKRCPDASGLIRRSRKSRA